MKNENRLYFGTFNPIHVGHLIIANHMAENSDLDQVWLVVTPHNPFKKKSTLLDDYHLQMAHLATEDFPKLKPSDIEFKLSQPNYTVNTLVHLEEKYPNHEFSLIMGKTT
jgi:nicotinate-nucleotide adenylyltransferase